MDSGGITLKRIIQLLLIIALGAVSTGLTAQENEQSSDNPFGQSHFVPDISLLIDCSYAYRSLDDREYNSLTVPAFSRPGAENPAEEIDSMNARRGFNFNYGELVIASTVDPYFDLFAVLTLMEDEFAIEEAYVTTRKLPLGFQVKAGKFLSSFGRINEQHSHFWDFADSPLVYSVLFGSSMLNEKGLRLTWVAPTDIYIMFGAEALQGDNRMSYGSEGFSDSSGSVDVEESPAPNLYVAYMKSSFDIGDASVLLGISNSYGKARINNNIDGSGSGFALHGHSSISGADLTVKYVIDSIRSVSLQGEYLYRIIRGDRYERGESTPLSEEDYRSVQSGMYAQFVAKVSKQWRAGARYDLLHLNRIEIDGTRQEQPENLPRYSAMIEYNPTEFSRLRLQYGYDRSRHDETAGEAQLKPFHALYVQMNIAIGAHGAHAF